MYVSLATSRDDINARQWTVASTSPTGGTHYRIIVASADNVEPRTISVLRSAVSPLALVPMPNQIALPLLTPIAEANQTASAVEHYLAGGAGGANGGGSDWRSRLNIWFPLPGLGENSLLLRESTDPNYRLVMFPSLAQRSLELWFYSAWAGELILLQDFDYIKLCPACQNWPWCAWCERFLFPVSGHRGSKGHDKALCYLNYGGSDRCRSELQRRHHGWD